MTLLFAIDPGLVPLTPLFFPSMILWSGQDFWRTFIFIYILLGAQNPLAPLPKHTSGTFRTRALTREGSRVDRPTPVHFFCMTTLHVKWKGDTRPCRFKKADQLLPLLPKPFYRMYRPQQPLETCQLLSDEVVDVFTAHMKMSQWETEIGRRRGGDLPLVAYRVIIAYATLEGCILSPAPSKRV